MRRRPHQVLRNDRPVVRLAPWPKEDRLIVEALERPFPVEAVPGGDHRLSVLPCRKDGVEPAADPGRSAGVERLNPNLDNRGPIRAVRELRRTGWSEGAGRFPASIQDAMDAAEIPDPGEGVAEREGDVAPPDHAGEVRVGGRPIVHDTSRRADPVQPALSETGRIAGTSMSCPARSTLSYAARSYSGVCGNGRHASKPTLVPR